MIPNDIIPSNPMRGAVNKTSETPFGHEYGEGPKLSDMMKALDATPAPEPQPEVAAEPVAWDVQEFKLWKGINPENPVWYSRGFSCSTWAAANELMEYLQYNCPELLLRVAPVQHSPAGAAPGSTNDLVARLVNYRPTNEWGDPVHHAICDEAAVALRALATPPVVEEAVKAEMLAALKKAREWVELGPELPGISAKDEADARQTLAEIDAAIARSATP